MRNIFDKDDYEDGQENSPSEIEELKNLIERILAMDDADSEPDAETKDWEAEMEKKIQDVKQGKIRVFDSDPEDLLKFVRKARLQVRVVSSTPAKQGKGNK
ncbi:MAG: hypothetical protein CVU48_01175 [Candidatus Cloacimonetes bacterium HGW-Cloacimonetes-1]|nr:MAG: hypothetical protein CVU48_01175 [Candidatus Cloacimonetes bacterium HGW-Cloacimonetes-1]